MVRLVVRLTPRAGRTCADGWTIDPAGRPYLKVRVAAAPVDGAANEALISFLAQTLRRPRTSVRIAAGETARLKMIDIDGLSDEELSAFGEAPV